MLDFGIFVGVGSDVIRVFSYNFWVVFYWMVVGKIIGGFFIYDEKNKFDRKVVLELYLKGSVWFFGDEGKKGILVVGQFVDIVVLFVDYFIVLEEEIKDFELLFIIMGGQVVYGNDEFKNLLFELLLVLFDWLLTGVYGYGGVNLVNIIFFYDFYDNKLYSCSNFFY